MIRCGDGWWVLIDKPPGITSFDVVARVRRITGIRRIGHAGSLDPAATGLLVIAVGSATRQIETRFATDKSYRAEARLGLLSPSWDADAEWTMEVRPPQFRREELEQALAEIVRTGSQVPPMISALKRQGRRLYQLAHRGWWIEREPREVRIERIELEEYQSSEGRFSFRVSGGGGMYVRSIAWETGLRLGIPCALTGLRRTAVGEFSIEDACSIEQFAEVWRREVS